MRARGLEQWTLDQLTDPHARQRRVPAQQLVDFLLERIDWPPSNPSGTSRK
jgi:hypothetical protein